MTKFIIIGAVGLFAVASGLLSPESFQAWFTNIWVEVFKSAVFTTIAGSSIIGFILYQIASQN